MGGADPRCRATVVITTHDRPEHARRAVRSALAQTVVDLEVLVVDDGSTPPFLAPDGDERLRIVRRAAAGGVCAARNAGLAEARGEWITFLDDDDELAPDMLEQTLAAAAGSSLPAPIAVMGSLAIVATDGTVLERCDPPSLRKGEHYHLEGRGNLRAQNSLVIPTRVVREIGGWDQQFELFEGDDFGIRLNRVASIQACEPVVYLLTQHDEPRLTARQSAIPRDMERTLAKHEALFRQHRRAHAKHMSTLGMYHVRAGNRRAALTWTVRGLVRDPSRPRAWLYAGAALVGPRALQIARRVRAPEAGVPARVLMRRRTRKYARRLVNYPRALAAAPFIAFTQTRRERIVPAHDVERTRSVLLLCIYRAANAHHVTPIVRDAAVRGWEVRLWTLDRVVPELALWTVGSGPGAKFPLLERLAGTADRVDGFDWIVVTDDDVAFAGGRVARLLAVAERAGLDLVQPAHTELSHRNNEITRRRPLSLARRTTFVEIGPVFAVRGSWSGRVMAPFGRHTMGWGLELEWSDLTERGLRLGVVDSVAVRHLRPAGKTYDWREQDRLLLEQLAARGHASVLDAQRTVATWRPWRADAPWSLEFAGPESTRGVR